MIVEIYISIYLCLLNVYLYWRNMGELLQTLIIKKWMSLVWVWLHFKPCYIIQLEDIICIKDSQIWLLNLMKNNLMPILDNLERSIPKIWSI